MQKVNASMASLISHTNTMRVLYVEDNYLMQKSTGDILSLLFMSVDACSNGKEALEKYHRSRYDLVITDLTMPVMNGIELIRNIKAIDPNQNIIVLSADFDRNFLRQLHDLNVLNYITKPFMFETLMERIRDTLRIDQRN